MKRAITKLVHQGLFVVCMMFLIKSVVATSRCLSFTKSTVAYYFHTAGVHVFSAHFKQLHGTGKSSAITSFVVIVETNVSSSVNSFP